MNINGENLPTPWDHSLSYFHAYLLSQVELAKACVHYIQYPDNKYLSYQLEQDKQWYDMYLVGILMVAVPASNNNPPNAGINLQGPFGRGDFSYVSRL